VKASISNQQRMSPFPPIATLRGEGRTCAIDPLWKFDSTLG
jgi:hypothetical protein